MKRSEMEFPLPVVVMPQVAVLCCAPNNLRVMSDNPATNGPQALFFIEHIRHRLIFDEDCESAILEDFDDITPD